MSGITENAIYYDENLSAGLIARAPPPSQFSSVNVTWSSKFFDASLEASNLIYIDISTKFDYSNGAFIEVKMDNTDSLKAFSFKTACTNAANLCDPA